MPRKRRKRREPEIWSREVTVLSYRAHISLRAVHDRKNDEPYIESGPWLELRGTTTEPVRDVVDVSLSLHAEDKPQIGPARPAAIGAIISLKPAISAVLTWPQQDFVRLWIFALAGQLKYAWLAFTKPRYTTALVISASFSNVPEE